MDIPDFIAGARDAASVRRVYGEPYERDGIVFIPAAEVLGGGGGGGGSDPANGTSGSGGGYGVRARPVGAYVIEDGRVRWEPATDATRLAARGLAAAVVIAFIAHRAFR